MNNKRKNKGLFILILILSALPAGANPGDTTGWENSGYLEESPEIREYLGFTMQNIWDTFGVPAEVFPFRGEDEWQDNVVFYYPNHVYLFLFDNRVWQIRIDSRYEKNITGTIKMGTSKDTILRRLGEAFYEDSESCMYILPDHGVPVRMRLFFKDDTLNDVYIYRGDF